MYLKLVKKITVKLATLDPNHYYKVRVFWLPHSIDFFFFFFFFFAMPMTCENSQARDSTHTTAVTQASAETMPDP